MCLKEKWNEKKNEKRIADTTKEREARIDRTRDPANQVVRITPFKTEKRGKRDGSVQIKDEKERMKKQEPEEEKGKKDLKRAKRTDERKMKK